MKKTNFNNYTSPALSATTLNNLQNDIETAINGVHSVINLNTTITANTNYTLPISYTVGKNDLQLLYCGELLIKDKHYIEVGEKGELSNTIKFLDNIGGIDMSEVNGFEDFVETLEIVVRGDYNE